MKGEFNLDVLHFLFDFPSKSVKSEHTPFAARTPVTKERR